MLITRLLRFCRCGFGSGLGVGAACQTDAAGQYFRAKLAHHGLHKGVLVQGGFGLLARSLACGVLAHGGAIDYAAVFNLLAHGVPEVGG